METHNKAKYSSISILLSTLTVALFIITSCDLSGNSSDSNQNPDWLIPVNEVVDGGPGKDGIPSIDNPDFINVSEVDFIPNDRMILGVRVGNEIRGYPHQILDWHEIVNDVIDDKPVAVVFCPLTGTGQAWNRTINGNVTQFGVSGLLFRNNVIPYDRNTDSNWSQMQLRSVNGQLNDVPVEIYPVIETTWATWKELYPISKIHSLNTGFSRNYQAFTYGADFSINHSRILFPIKNEDNRLQRKIRVLGIINAQKADESTTVRAYPINQFGEGISVIHDSIENDEYIIVGSTGLNFSAAFQNRLGSTTGLQFEAVEDNLPIVMKDENGNHYDLFGYIIEGPDAGSKLEPATSYTGYWYGWADFFPGIEIYSEI